MKKVLTLSLLFVFMFVMVACGDENSNSDDNTNDATTNTAAPAETEQVENDEKVQIEFWHAMSGSNQEALDRIVEGYNTSQDKYEVVAEFQGSYEESLTKLRSVGGTSDAPAMMQVFEVGTKYMIDSGYIEPVQTFIEKDNYDITQLEENILNYYSS